MTTAELQAWKAGRLSALGLRGTRRTSPGMAAHRGTRGCVSQDAEHGRGRPPYPMHACPLRHAAHSSAYFRKLVWHSGMRARSSRFRVPVWGLNIRASGSGNHVCGPGVQYPIPNIPCRGLDVQSPSPRLHSPALGIRDSIRRIQTSALHVQGSTSDAQSSGLDVPYPSLDIQCSGLDVQCWIFHAATAAFHPASPQWDTGI